MEFWTAVIQLRTAPLFGTRVWVYLYATNRDDARSGAVAFTERVAGAIGESTSEMTVERVARLPKQRPSDIPPGRSLGEIYRFEIAIAPLA